MLIKIENGQPTGYPVLEENFRYLFPSEVFPLVLNNEIVNPFGYAMYDFSQQPTVAWHQDLTEGSPVKDQFGIWRQNWVVTSLSGEVLSSRIADRKEQLIRRIDIDVDGIYATTIGNRATEYLLAESEARAFKAANYTGTIPYTVQGWANIRGWTPREAADDVIAASDNWRAAQLTIRSQRLTFKETTRTASTVNELDTILNNWNQFVTAVKQQLNV